MWYQIDAEDRITCVSPKWEPFAHLNGAPQLDLASVAGRPIWQFFQGQATRYYYDELFDLTRKRQTATSVKIRCDGPHIERHLLLNLAPIDGGIIEITVKTLRECETAYLPMWDAKLIRSSEFLTVCSWCKMVDVGSGQWQSLVEAMNRLEILNSSNPPEATHGICGTCQVTLETELAVEFA